MMTKVNCNEQWCRWNRNGKWCVAEEIKMSKKAGEIVCKTKEMFYDERYEKETVHILLNLYR